LCLTDKTRFVSGVKVVRIEGYNFGAGMESIRYLTVKGVNCSHIDLIDSKTIDCLLTHLSANESVENSDVTLSTVSSTSTGVHLQPLSIARGQSRRAVMAKITTRTTPFVPYGVAYPLASSSVAPMARDSTFVYWSDIGARRMYRCLVTGVGVEVLLTNVSTMRMCMCWIEV
jgi:hypothetical protein